MKFLVAPTRERRRKEGVIVEVTKFQLVQANKQKITTAAYLSKRATLVAQEQGWLPKDKEEEPKSKIWTP